MRPKVIALALISLIPLFALSVGVTQSKQAAATTSPPWATYHLDNTHGANDTSEPAFSSVAKAWDSATFDGQVYAEPLIVGSTAYVVTENNTVYAVATSSGATVWSLHLAAPVASSSLPCGNIGPSVGITSTPVVDTATNTLYAAGFTQPAGQAARHLLFAVNLGTRSLSWSAAVDPPGSTPTSEQLRGSLALAGGMVYIPYGALAGDCTSFHGYLVGVSAANGGGMVTWQSTPSSHGGGIWAPSGPAVDSTGSVYVATGNGYSSSSTYDYAESVVKLSPSLALQDYFAPSDWSSLDSSDTDIGSVGPTLLSNGLIFQCGKNGRGYLLRSSALGHIGGEAFSAPMNNGGCFGGVAFDGQRIYVACSNGLVALTLNTAVPSFSVAWSATGYFAGAPIVAGGAVWVLNNSSGRLNAYDPASGAPRFPSIALTMPTSHHFATPSAAGGKILVPLNNSLEAFNLVAGGPTPSPSPSQPPPGDASQLYTLDGWGGVHPANGSPALSYSGYWPNWDIARGIALFPDGKHGYVLDGFGGLHPVGNQTAAVQPGAYWQNWDIARGIALAPWATPAQPAGWVLDGWGGVHPFGGAPVLQASAYWPGWDIARGLVILPDSTTGVTRGYVLDGFGGLHALGPAPEARATAYWPNWDIARSVTLLPSSTNSAPQGYVLDGWGGLHPFGGAPQVPVSGYWPNWDIARSVTVWTAAPVGSPGGWVLDGWGGLHTFGSTQTPAVSSGAYWPNWDIARGSGGAGTASSGAR